VRRAALLAAAGAGERLGLGPKAFVRLGGATLLELAAEALAPHVDEVVVAVPHDRLEEASRLLPGARVVAGAASRQATVHALLRHATSEVVLVHDVARPFATPEVVARVLAAVAASGAASAALGPADTVVEAASGAVLPREGLRLVQTPQGFRRELLLAAHERALEEGVAATDDAALVRRLGVTVTLVEGSPLLAKLTAPADLALMEALLGVWRRELARPAAHGGGAA